MAWAFSLTSAASVPQPFCFPSRGFLSHRPTRARRGYFPVACGLPQSVSLPAGARAWCRARPVRRPQALRSQQTRRSGGLPGAPSCCCLPRAPSCCCLLFCASFVVVAAAALSAQRRHRAWYVTSLLNRARKHSEATRSVEHMAVANGNRNRDQGSALTRSHRSLNTSAEANFMLVFAANEPLFGKFGRIGVHLRSLRQLAASSAWPARTSQATR